MGCAGPCRFRASSGIEYARQEAERGENVNQSVGNVSLSDTGDIQVYMAKRVRTVDVSMSILEEVQTADAGGRLF